MVRRPRGAVDQAWAKLEEAKLQVYFNISAKEIGLVMAKAGNYRYVPNAVSVKGLIAAQVEILYTECSSVENDWASGVPKIVGSLEVGFSVLDMALSRP